MEITVFNERIVVDFDRPVTYFIVRLSTVKPNSSMGG